MARSMLPGRLLDPSSNVGAREMITLPALPGRQNSAYRPASALINENLFLELEHSRAFMIAPQDFHPHGDLDRRHPPGRS